MSHHHHHLLHFPLLMHKEYSQCAASLLPVRLQEKSGSLPTFSPNSAKLHGLMGNEWTVTPFCCEAPAAKKIVLPFPFTKSISVQGFMLCPGLLNAAAADDEAPPPPFGLHTHTRIPILVVQGSISCHYLSPSSLFMV
eukprot:TRINITY_DN10647_c0_g1_i1.p1 TRINITY_DN10647_c0_g1~~TRINITY_DN10647_c0_g1_i1.p1  ORF type:complete len:138 (-),score=16.29 TRINITY_DN10647_c0_g1_i1:76-489(-)